MEKRGLGRSTFLLQPGQSREAEIPWEALEKVHGGAVLLKFGR